MAGFFLEGETSLLGLSGASGGVPGRERGGALHGERFFVGVGEYVRRAGASCDDEVVGRDAANEDVRTCVGGGKTKDARGSGESVKSMSSCAQFEMVLWSLQCGGRMEVSTGSARSLDFCSCLISCGSCGFD